MSKLIRFEYHKTGKRTPIALGLEYNGNISGKCPLFPDLNWWNIDKKGVGKLKELFNFAEYITQ